MTTNRKAGRPRLYEAGGVKQLLYLPLELLKWLREESKRTSRPMSQIVVEAVEQYKARS